jgi:hypothetical protein
MSGVEKGDESAGASGVDSRNKDVLRHVMDAVQIGRFEGQVQCRKK